jgi:hypothetical protein
MNKIYILVGIFLIILVYSFMKITYGTKEGLSRRHKRKRRRRAAERQGWWRGSGYLQNGAGINQPSLQLPMGYRDNYTPSVDKRYNFWNHDAGNYIMTNKTIGEFNYEVGCARDRHSGHCGDKNNFNRYYRPMMNAISRDSYNKFFEKRYGKDNTWNIDLENRVINKIKGTSDSAEKNWNEKKYLYSESLLSENKGMDIENIKRNSGLTYEQAIEKSALIIQEWIDTKYVEDEKKRRDGSNVVEQFESNIEYINPTGKSFIDDVNTWENIKNEVLSSKSNKDELSKIHHDIVDKDNNVTLPNEQYEEKFKEKYIELSLPIQHLYENSARENIRLKAAIYPSLNKQNNSNDNQSGMTNLMKEGLNINKSETHVSCINENCKSSPSSYPSIYK